MLSGEQDRLLRSLYAEHLNIRRGNGAAAIHIRRTSGSSDTYYIHQDHLGSPELITGAGGSVVARLSFSAYGERRDDDHDGAIPAGELGALANVTRRGFTGHEHLDNVGLIHMNGRVYDPRIGRFLGVDPIVVAGHSQGANAFAYVWNNPLNYTDPSGFCPTSGFTATSCPLPTYGSGPHRSPFLSELYWGRFPWPNYDPAIPATGAYESPAMQVTGEERATFTGTNGGDEYENTRPIFGTDQGSQRLERHLLAWGTVFVPRFPVAVEPILRPAAAEPAIVRPNATAVPRLPGTVKEGVRTILRKARDARPTAEEMIRNIENSTRNTKPETRSPDPLPKPPTIPDNTSFGRSNWFLEWLKEIFDPMGMESILLPGTSPELEPETDWESYCKQDGVWCA